MYHVRQEDLFSFDQLMEMQSESKYSAILEHLPVSKILHVVNKKSRRGRPETQNTRAMIYSLVIGNLEQIPTIKLLVRRLKDSLEFRNLCRFTGADPIPSRSAYTRLIAKLHHFGVLSETRDDLVLQSISEGFINGQELTLALDSSHVEAQERNPKRAKSKEAIKEEAVSPSPSLIQEQPEANSSSTNTKPEKPKRGKRGRVPKAEQEEWKRKLEAYEESLSLYEKKIEKMLPVPYEELLKALPKHPSVGTKGDPRRTGKVFHWFGYKAGLLVDTASQYIVSGLWCSASVHEQRLAIVLLKGLKEKFPMLSVKHILGDKGYDGEAVYVQARNIGAFALIPLIHHKAPPEGRNEDYAPVCTKGHTYRYDSFDAKYETIKYTRPKECSDCPLQNSGGCQKVYKIRIEDNLRLHTVPARSSESFKTLYNKRTAVERVFSYLKESFGLGGYRLRGRRAEVGFELSALTYTLCKFALDKLNQKMQQENQAA